MNKKLFRNFMPDVPMARIEFRAAVYSHVFDTCHMSYSMHKIFGNIVTGAKIFKLLNFSLLKMRRNV